MKSKEKFLMYCELFKNELEDLQSYIDFENEKNACTLAFVGANYSYELANICFELGYACWFFYYKENMDYKDLKQGIYDTIICDLNITKEYNEKQLEKIKKDILKAKKN